MTRARRRRPHKTIVIEAYRELGGACINWGTLASKTLRESALFLSGFRTRQLGEGLNVQFKADITLNSFMYRKNLVQRREQERAARNLAAPWHNIVRMTGVARIVDPNTVEVTCPDGAVKKARGKIILVATGSTPARPKNVHFNDDNIFDATTVLEMKQLPKSMVVIGGGGEITSELVHIGLASMSFGGDIDFFIHTVFNYPTLSDVYKYAAYSALGHLNKARDAAAKHDGRGNLALIDGQSAAL